MSALAAALVAQLAMTPACTAPGMMPELLAALVLKESGRDPLALHDDTDHHAYFPQTVETATELTRQLMAKGHSVGVGLAQLTAKSELAFTQRFGLTVSDALLIPCANMRAGAKVFVSGSLSIYNSGSPTRSLNYAADVSARLRIASAAVRGSMPTPTCPDADPTGWHETAACPSDEDDDDWHVTINRKDSE